MLYTCIKRRLWWQCWQPFVEGKFTLAWSGLTHWRYSKVLSLTKNPDGSLSLRSVRQRPDEAMRTVFVTTLPDLGFTELIVR
jgi:hypothetical protein